MNEVLIAALTGGVLVAVIEGVREALKWRRQRKAVKEDRAEEKAEQKTEKKLEALEKESKEQQKVLKAQSEALKFLLYDRIRYIGQSYIADGEIDFDDRHILNEMHRSYHFGLGGNGDLDTLMEEVNHLPLKKR